MSKSSLGPIPLLNGVRFETASRRGRWVTTLTRNDEVIAEEDAATLPWVDPRAPGRLAARLHEADPLLDQKAAKAAILEVFDAVRSSEDSKDLTSEVVERVIKETAVVKVEMSDPPVYVVDLNGGQSLVFEAREIAGRGSSALNERWLSMHPTAPLRATKRDFDEITDYWLSIAEQVDPLGCASVWESVTEKLQIKVAPLSVHPTKDGLVKSGLFQEEGGPLWIAGRLIGGVLNECGRAENDSRFSRYLDASGVLVHPSKPIRVGGMLIRAWGFRPDFMPGDIEVSDFTDLSGEEVDRS